MLSVKSETGGSRSIRLGRVTAGGAVPSQIPEGSMPTRVWYRICTILIAGCIEVEDS
jgi:hypothetical protein